MRITQHRMLTEEVAKLEFLCKKYYFPLESYAKPMVWQKNNIFRENI